MTKNTVMQGHILLERALPLSWCVVESAHTEIPVHNPALFAMLESMEEKLPHTADVNKSDELQRIEAKLNVVMSLLSELLQTRQPRPPTQLIRFTNETLAWQLNQALPVGSLVDVQLYPDAALPMPLRFVGKVLAVTGGWMEVDMHSLGEDEQGAWSRWVFRQHRRQVAQVRQYSGQPLAEK